jgi:ADP-ribose pyrophosphatase YjhB (NUDIX family)
MSAQMWWPRIILEVVLLGLVVALAATWVGEQFHPTTVIAIVVVVGLVAIWLLILVSRVILQIVTAGRYAVEALIFDDDGRVLLYFHPYHKVFLPPGGRCRRGEFPEQALVRNLHSRLGIKESDWLYDRRFHIGVREQNKDLGTVVRIPEPWIVQREERRQRHFVARHYDFIYVLRYKGSGKWSGTHSIVANFYPLKEIERILDRKELWPDVYDACVLADRIRSDRPEQVYEGSNNAK